ncbi:hypothetical protein IQ06DRAFT_290611 [Phaeosphaeriaceae sp. SRC1lsM3a]|nr:hypothetical protein IQ06DRAFT_290611 [Stagonospora sp. SRC1lsM3a]
MSAQQTTQSASVVSMDEQNSAIVVENQGPLPGGLLRLGLDRLTRILERRIDRQVLEAQMRAYESYPDLSEKPRYM